MLHKLVRNTMRIMSTVAETCQICAGSGIYNGQQCASCMGSGQRG